MEHKSILTPVLGQQTPEIPLAPPEPTPPKITLRVSRDAMQAELLLVKTSKNTLAPTMDDIHAALAENNITFGINDILIQAICRRPVYRPMVIAKGRPPRVGKNGELHFFIEKKRDLRPKIHEDGTVDYRDLGYTQNVLAGQSLCEIVPPTKGEDGTNVFGELCEGQFGRAAVVPAGKNTFVNEDGTLLLAECNGTVEFSGGTINVHDILRINGNVDHSTGDVHFLGDIIVTGNVLAGFTVRTSEGNITIMGNVESANLYASGDIVIGYGINGMERGVVEAEGSLKCKYIQSCTVKVGGNIYTDTIMYSHIECSGNVELKGKRAALIGGTSAIVGKLTAKTIGSDAGIATKIIMASTGVENTQKIADLQSEIVRIDMETRKLLQDMTRYESLMKEHRLTQVQHVMALQAREQYLEAVANREKIILEQQKLKDEQLTASHMETNTIECTGHIYVGVHFTFGPLSLHVNTPLVYSRVCIIDNDIAVSPL